MKQRAGGGHPRAGDSVVGEKVRAALDQNRAGDGLVVQPDGGLIGQQNRKLGELDRKVSNLGGQSTT